MNNGILAQGASPVQMPLGLAGRPHRVPMPDHSWHPEAADWRRRVFTNGGQPTDREVRAISDFCGAVDRSQLRDKFYRYNPFMGGLLGSLVPLYRGPVYGGTVFGGATETNSNFVSGDWTLTGGLKGNGTTKHLDTGLPGTTFSADDRHCSAYWTANATLTGSRSFISNTSTVGDKSWLDIHSRFASDGSEAQVTDSYALTHTAANSHQLFQYKPGPIAESFSNGGDKKIRDSWPVGVPTVASQNWHIFSLNPALFGGVRTDARISCYSIGVSMSDAQALAIYNLTLALQVAIGRS